MIQIQSLLDEIILFVSHMSYANPSRCSPSAFDHGDHGRKFVHPLSKPQAPAQFLTLVQTRFSYLDSPKITEMGNQGQGVKYRTQKLIEGSPLLGWLERFICFFGNVIREKEYFVQSQNNMFEFTTTASVPQSRFYLFIIIIWSLLTLFFCIA